MATAISSISFSLLISALWGSLFILCFSRKGYALDGGLTSADTHFHSLHINSLLPDTVCKPSATGHRKRASSLKLVHRRGPCSRLKVDKASAPNIAQILSEDQSRVNSIHSRLKLNSGIQSLQHPEATLQGNAGQLEDSEVSLPAKSGSSLGTGNYIVVVGLGKPKTDYSLVFDTGSDITWTQCKPCVRSCYPQQENLFDPKSSTTYKNVSCNSPQCSQLTSATGNVPDCSGGTCVYGIQYGDRSYSVGFFATETLTLKTDELPDILFGCGQKNEGLFGEAAGLLGLGRNKLSLVSQTASKYGEYFSYCLPTRSSSSGYLTFGKGGQSNALKLTPMTANPKGPSFYFIDVKGIKVGGQTLSIPQSVFSTPGTIIDSGTVITRLPPAAYNAMRTTFRQQMKNYTMTRPLSILDTCYDFSNYTTVSIPKISFIFAPAVEVPIAPQGILYGSLSQLCLAFAGNGDASDPGIFGNIQQQTLEVAYDVAGGSLGFGPGGCS
ncbi:Nepenthesin [Bertholletia excelsa]